jgi:hypothetical protein
MRGTRRYAMDAGTDARSCMGRGSFPAHPPNTGISRPRCVRSYDPQKLGDS